MSRNESFRDASFRDSLLVIPTNMRRTGSEAGSNSVVSIPDLAYDFEQIVW